MQFVPNYCVSYRGKFYNAGCAFEIDREDVEEMSRHGTAMEDVPAMETQTELRKPGRPKKTDTE